MRFSAYDVSASRPTAVNVIAGRSGVGKTRAINALLRQRPDGERWAVLVNEQGGTAIDVDLMGDPWDGAGEQLLSYVAGCPCCSASVSFRVALVQLLRQRPDRLLIEPGSVDALRSLLALLDADGIRAAVDLRGVVALVDAPPAAPAPGAREAELPYLQAATAVVASARPDAGDDGTTHVVELVAQLPNAPRFAGTIVGDELPLRVLDGADVR